MYRIFSKCDGKFPSSMMRDITLIECKCSNSIKLLNSRFFINIQYNIDNFICNITKNIIHIILKLKANNKINKMRQVLLSHPHNELIQITIYIYRNLLPVLIF